MIHLYIYDAFVHVWYICTCMIHLYIYDTFVHVWYTLWASDLYGIDIVYYLGWQGGHHSGGGGRQQHHGEGGRHAHQHPPHHCRLPRHRLRPALRDHLSEGALRLLQPCPTHRSTSYRSQTVKREWHRCRTAQIDLNAKVKERCIALDLFRETLMPWARYRFRSA